MIASVSFAANKPLPLLMGVLNVTPDSFSDGGRYAATDKAIAHARRMMDEGCDILDIGGESTRPASMPVTPQDEQKRVLPVFEALRSETQKRGVMLSIDTRHSSTMRAAWTAGADMFNDITALTYDPLSLQTAAEAKVPVVLMHMKGEPQTMQKNPSYENVVNEVFDYLGQRIMACIQAGIPKSMIIVDPGLGFGKTAQHSLTLLKNIGKFHELGVPVMLGASRKSFIDALAGPASPDDRLAGSLTAALYGAGAGIQLLRVHDVKETRQALTLAKALQA
jgi:dihydropteroate synthase